MHPAMGNPPAVSSPNNTARHDSDDLTRLGHRQKVIGILPVRRVITFARSIPGNGGRNGLEPAVRINWSKAS